MDKQTALLLGLHCHQPVDNFHHVVDEAIEKSYKPFFEVASKYKDFKFSLHYSGWLLEYIKKSDEELFSLMRVLAQNGQIEFLTGGFYEPILASISSSDRKAQIKKLNDFIEENFNQAPKGLWLSERVWDSAIVKDLIHCGIEYVVVDDYHFIAAGFDKKNLNGYFLTEDEGEILKIFPINKHLRYTIPFENPLKVKEYLESIGDEIISAGVIFDDGEKFGIWPKTHEWVYEKKWLENFIEEILKSDIVKCMLYKEYLHISKPISLAYLPITSYMEMGEWALGAKENIELHKIENALEKDFSKDDIEKFVKGSIWKNFLVKYPEANRIQKRYTELSNNKIEDENYLESLYKAQTNDVLWHGVFGGIYLPNLRDNAYRFIIDCENIRYFEKECTEIKDINLDGYDEIKCVSKNLITIFDTKSGAQLVEFDIRDRSFNLQNGMSRYFESYHEKILNPSSSKKETQKPKNSDEDEDCISTIHEINEDIDKYKKIIRHDWHTKNSFIDHITDFEANLQSFDASNFNEYGDFANQPFELVYAKDQKVKLRRYGGIYKNSQKTDARVTKSFHTKDERIDFEISILSKTKERFYYLLEHNFHFANLKDLKITAQSLNQNSHIKVDGVNESFEILNSNILMIFDKYTKKEITIEFSKAADIFLSPLDTVSQSESGFELTNQALSLGFKFLLESPMKLTGTIEVR